PYVETGCATSPPRSPCSGPKPGVTSREVVDASAVRQVARQHERRADRERLEVDDPVDELRRSDARRDHFDFADAGRVQRARGHLDERAARIEVERAVRQTAER